MAKTPHTATRVTDDTTTPTSLLARRRESAPRFLTSFAGVGALVCLVLLCSAGGIAWLQQHADERRSSQLALADLQLGLGELRALATNAASEGEITAGTASDADLLNGRIDRTVSASARGFPGDLEVAGALDAVQRLREIVRDELTLVAQGRVAEAVRLDREQLEPGYARFSRRIDDARDAAGRSAEDAVSLARAGTLALLAAAAGILILLLVRFRAASRRAREAYYDPLTGLANRMLLGDRLAHALAVASRRNEDVAVLFLDLDDFKLVNDSLGHAAGDRLLVLTAERVFGIARASDTVARLGGDEFAFLLENTGAEGAQRFAQRIREALRRPFTVDGRPLTIGGTIGFAIGRPGEADQDDLLRNADLAMYAGKHKGKGIIVPYEPTMYQALAERLDLETELRGALDRSEIALVYQPIVNVQTGTLTAVEALARWQHPTRGEIAPAVFIPIAEETGLIRELGRWVLHEACRRAQGWQQGRSGMPPIGVTVNVSPAQFLHDELVADVRSALEQSGLEPGRLTLEITESVLIDRSDAFVVELEQLSALGIRLAVDDFGTGYSSLSSLSRFPVDILKIDGSFVAGMERDDESWALVRSIVQLGQTLGLEAVAEGIEGQGQVDALQDAGCTFGQGFHFARPVDADVIGAMIGALTTIVPAADGGEREGGRSLRPPRAA